MARHTGTVLGMLFVAHAAAAQFTQQGGKLVGPDAMEASTRYTSVAISEDGTIAVTNATTGTVHFIFDVNG